MIAHQRLDRERIAQRSRGLERRLERVADPAARHRNAGIAEQLLGPVLVVGDAIAEQLGTPRHGRLDALLAMTMTELDVTAVLAESRPGNTALAGRGDDRSGGRPQHVRVAHRLEPRQDRRHVDRPAIEQPLDERHRLDAGSQPTGLVPVTVDDVVNARFMGVQRLAVAYRETDQVLQFDRHVLDDMPGPGTARQALQEAAGTTERAAMLLEGGQLLGDSRNDAGHTVARPLLKLADIQAHEDSQVATVVVRPAQRPMFENIHRRLREAGLERVDAEIAPCLDVEPVTADQGMQDHVLDRHRLAHRQLGDIRAGQLATVDDDHMARTDRLEHAVGMNDHRRVLAEPDPQLLGVGRPDFHQPGETAALEKVAVDDQTLDQPQPGGHVDRALAQRILGGAVVDHGIRQSRRARAGAGHHRAGPRAGANRLERGRTAHHIGQPQLIAAGEEDYPAALDQPHDVILGRLLTIRDRQGMDFARAQPLEGCLVDGQYLLGNRTRGGNYRDFGVARRGEGKDLVEDRQVRGAVLGAADRDQRAGGREGGFCHDLSPPSDAFDNAWNRLGISAPRSVAPNRARNRHTATQSSCPGKSGPQNVLNALQAVNSPCPAQSRRAFKASQ